MRLTPVRVSVIALAFAAIGATAAFYAPALIAQDQAAVDPNAPVTRSSDEIYSDLTLFGEVFDRIRAEYVDAPDERTLIHAAIQGMLSSLDPHSAIWSRSTMPTCRKTRPASSAGWASR